MKYARTLAWLALGVALGFYGITVAQAQTLSVPLPPGCTAPTISGTTVSCDGAPPPSTPVLSFTPAALTFNDQQVGQASGTQAVTFRNSGGGTITLGAHNKTGPNAADFVRTGNCSNGFVLQGATTCVSYWSFQPAAAGSRLATATVASSAGDVSYAMTGTAVTPTPPAVSCGDLQVIDAGAFTFTPQTTWDMALGKGDKSVWIASYTATQADVGKRSSTSIAEHVSNLHYKTVWASKTKCEMTEETKQGVSSAPNVYVSVNGTEPVNMKPGETWYFMYRALDRNGKNTCMESQCGNRFTAYSWQNASTMAFQRGGPIPSDSRKKVVKKKK